MSFIFYRKRNTWVPLYEHLQALEEIRVKFEEERDRRYTEIAIEREKALKIKDLADRDAMQLARDIQTYKDERDNRLREQINQERVGYATKSDLTSLAKELQATVKPLVEFVARSRGGSAVYGQLAIGAGLIMTAIALFLKL